jgi:hypothetical protein
MVGDAMRKLQLKSVAIEAGDYQYLIQPNIFHSKTVATQLL